MVWAEWEEWVEWVEWEASEVSEEKKNKSTIMKTVKTMITITKAKATSMIWKKTNKLKLSQKPEKPQIPLLIRVYDLILAKKLTFQINKLTQHKQE